MATPGIKKVGTNLYSIRVRVTCPRTGRRKEIERTRECTEREAIALQVRWRDELEATLARPSVARVRLGDFAASWLAGKRGAIKVGSAKYIAHVLDEHLDGTELSDLYIDDITPQDVAAWLARLSAKRTRFKRVMKPSTASTIYKVVRTIIREACAHARIANPCDLVRAPKRNRPRANFLRADEATKVLAWMAKHEPNVYPYALVTLTTGLRWSEIAALKWSDIREDEGTIHVVRNVYRGTVQNSTKNGDNEDAPRVVPLLPEVAEVLRERRQEMIRAQHPGLVEGWIFPRDDGRVRRTATVLHFSLERACKACGTERRISPHGLRHTSNDLLRRVASGVVTRSVIGHASEEMTQHYSHVDETERREAVRAAFGGVLGGSGGITGGTRERGSDSSSEKRR